MRNITGTKQKIAMIIEHCEYKGYYPFERAAILAQHLSNETSLFIFLKNANETSIQRFISIGITPILFDHFKELPKTIRNLQVDLIIYDGADSSIEQVEQIRPFCETLVHFDDFGEGAMLANFNLKALFEEPREQPIMNEVNGTYFFAVNDLLQEIRAQRQLKIKSFDEDAPHVVIYFEDGDANNLTFRTLRHLTQLHIPLKISVLLDNDYRHSTDELSMMALSRRNTKLVRDDFAITESLINADCLICNSLYTPYKAAFIGIPCITAAQHERELSNAFTRETNGFIHLGLGRKMKQSQIQNALMELLLHESRRERAVKRQQSLQLELNNDLLEKLILDLAYARYNIATN